MKFVYFAGIIGALVAAIESRRGSNLDEILHYPCKATKDCYPYGQKSDITHICDAKVSTLKQKGKGECRIAKNTKCISYLKKYKYDLDNGSISKEVYNSLIDTCENGYHCVTDKSESFIGVCTKQRRRF